MFNLCISCTPHATQFTSNALPTVSFFTFATVPSYVQYTTVIRPTKIMILLISTYAFYYPGIIIII